MIIYTYFHAGLFDSMENNVYIEEGCILASELEIQASSYITKCEEAVNNGDRAAARQLTEVIVNLYSKCIRGLTSGLTEYSHFDVTDYIKDIKTLKKKLETYQ